MEAGAAEPRRDAREFQRRAQEGLADALAVGRVVAALAIRAAEPDGAVGTAVVDELGGKDAAGAHHLAKMIDRLVDDGESVALAQVAVKVDIAAEDVRQLRGDAVGNTGGIGGAEQRVADLGGPDDHMGFQPKRLLAGPQSVVAVLFDHQCLVLAAVEREDQ